MSIWITQEIYKLWVLIFHSTNGHIFWISIFEYVCALCSECILNVCSHHFFLVYTECLCYCHHFFSLIKLFNLSGPQLLWLPSIIPIYEMGIIVIVHGVIVRTSTYIYTYTEKAMAPHSSPLAWKIPWTEEPGRLQSMESLRVGHDWATSLSLFTLMHWRRKWQPTPVFLPGEPQGQGSLVGCRPWGRTESDTTEVT